MQIEHISRSYRRQIRNRKNVCVRFGGQQDASTSKVSFGQPAQMCHNNPPTSRWVNPSQFYKSQRCPEKSTQGQQAKSQRSSKTVNPLTSIFVPGSTAFKNRTFHKFSAWLDQALTKVNAGQTFCETLAAENRTTAQPYGLSSSSFPRVAEIRPPGSSYSLGWERKMWVVLWWNSLQLFLYLYPSMRVCDTSVGHVSLHYKTGWPCTYNLLRIINSKYKFCSSD